MKILSELKKLAMSVLFPPLCLNCQKHLKNEVVADLCSDCNNSITVNTSLFCPVCNLRLADNKKVCHKNSQYLLAAAANYSNDSVKTLLKLFKFKKWQRLQKPLGEILVKYLKTLNLELKNWIVTPIPLHPDRESQRGFNQSLLLARTAADFYCLNLNPDILKRIKNTKTQSLAKNHEERARNVAGCFFAANPELVEGYNVLLVDDVHTSGATISEAARTLKSVGAKKIIALVVAKAK